MQKNPLIPFTYQYHQPDDYHFSIDSIELPWEVGQILKKENHDWQNFQVLDLCAGCGVVGFELQFHLPQINQIDFVEVQNIYREYFEKNLKLVKTLGKFQFLNLNYENMQVADFYQKYDLVISNPPYFFPEDGKLSPSDFKNRCRFFIDSTFENYTRCIVHVLKPGGRAYILLRTSESHGRDLLRELILQVAGRLKVTERGSIRGTQLIEMRFLEP